ncbi:hypothetical protein [Niveispirillum irakense]|uniref:hypothetical protein n=1 Tax=Niveispirillum irakense TaxID=34011 RepID=UPI0012B5694C|nr:hypothetical protein [Niveispirillum irakense]
MELLIGFLLGVVGSAIAGAWVQPLLSSVPAGWMIRVLARSRDKWRGPLTGNWSQKWEIRGSESWPDENISDMEIYQFRQWVVGYWHSISKNGRSSKYSLVGVVHRESYIVGTWSDVDGLGYMGGFMVKINPSKDCCEGRYVGHRTSGTIEAHDWQWVSVD